MNAIFEESSTTKEEPVENKEEYLVKKIPANTGNSFEHQLVVAVKWRNMKKTEDK